MAERSEHTRLALYVAGCNMRAVLLSVLYFLVNLGCILGGDIYESINWVPQNPMFIGDGKVCLPGARTLKVQLQSKVTFVCPNSAMVLQKGSSAVQVSSMYENLWLLYSKSAFDECDVTLDPKRRLNPLLSCKTPLRLTYSSVTFAQYTAEVDGLTFEGGKRYYFIATSDGTESHINNTHGGHCNGGINNIYMKLEVYVCKRSNLTYTDENCKDPDDIGKIECTRPTLPTTKPTPNVPCPTTNITSNQSSTTAQTSIKSAQPTPTTPPTTAQASIKSVQPTPTTPLTLIMTSTVVSSGASIGSQGETRIADDATYYKKNKWMIIAIIFIMISALLLVVSLLSCAKCFGMNKGSDCVNCSNNKALGFTNGTTKVSKKNKAVRQESILGVANQGYIRDKNSLSRVSDNGVPYPTSFYGSTFVEVEEEVGYDDVDGGKPTSACDAGDLPEKDASIVIQNDSEVYYEKIEKGEKGLDGVTINSSYPEASSKL